MSPLLYRLERRWPTMKLSIFRSIAKGMAKDGPLFGVRKFSPMATKVPRRAPGDRGRLAEQSVKNALLKVSLCY
jgi:hypothetical protein